VVAHRRRPCLPAPDGAVAHPGEGRRACCGLPPTVAGAATGLGRLSSPARRSLLHPLARDQRYINISLCMLGRKACCVLHPKPSKTDPSVSTDLPGNPAAVMSQITSRPRLRSITGHQGTRMNSLAFSTRAQRPEELYSLAVNAAIRKATPHAAALADPGGGTRARPHRRAHRCGRGSAGGLAPTPLRPPSRRRFVRAISGRGRPVAGRAKWRRHWRSGLSGPEWRGCAGRRFEIAPHRAGRRAAQNLSGCASGQRRAAGRP